MAERARYDLVVIGAGPGGYVAAIRAAQLGMRVACVEKAPALGGTCLRIGCIPSKALLDSSELFWNTRRHMAVHGIRVADVTLDLPAMMARKDKVVRGLTQGVAGLFKKNGVSHVTGTARITAPGRVEVARARRAGARVRAHPDRHGIGARPLARLRPRRAAHRVLRRSLGLRRRARAPARDRGGRHRARDGLGVGAPWLRGAGRGGPGSDRARHGSRDGAGAPKVLERQGLTFSLATAARKAAVEDGRVAVTIETGGTATTESFDRVLVAVGRRPYTADLGLEGAGVALDARGRITVDHRFETSVPGVHAIGDVIAGPMLAHKAEDEGIACVELLAGRAGHVNYDAIPSVVYTWPELAGVGKTEEECREAGRAVRIGRFPFMANGRARAAEERDGLVKIIADAGTDRVLGVHVLGPRASDLIAEAVLAMEFGGSAEDIARTCHAHPTFSEAVREAALDVDGRSIHQ